jgi:UDP-N-acetylmuramoyl-L-alanyl-D-glutamate--2,6-diaminopimelate ligase
MTNVTREHLDYHKSMEIYRQTKSKLFQRSKVAIVNLDMENPEEFLRHTNEKKITFSLKNDQADISASNVYLDIDKSSFTINEQQFVLNLVGDFNIENALAAITVAVSENIDLATCAKALEKITGVPGRMEYVPNDRGLNIIVDFALTPDALGKLYSALVRIKKLNARIIAVFGSCGERDRGKRPIMGEVVSRYADFVILTDDEPYHENPMQIIKNIESGITNKTENENFWIIPDRRAAIAKALQIAQADDLIAITGMGAEESMIVGDQKIPWNDRQVILEELKNIKNA